MAFQRSCQADLKYSHVTADTHFLTVFLLLTLEEKSQWEDFCFSVMVFLMTKQHLIIYVYIFFHLSPFPAGDSERIRQLEDTIRGLTKDLHNMQTTMHGINQRLCVNVASSP